MATQLYVRSVYSLLESMCKIEDIIAKSKEYGYKSVALTDKATLAGAKSFYYACKKENIKPIFGLEVPYTMLDREFNCILYAKNDDGYKNLMKLSSMLMTGEKDILSVDDINLYKDNNILVLLADDMSLTYVVDKDLDVDECINTLTQNFGNDFLVGLCDHDIKANVNRDNKIKQVLKRFDIKAVALNRTYYPNKDDGYEYEILKCINNKTVIDENAAIESGRHYLDKDEFSSMFDEEELKNTDVLASLCNVDLAFKTTLPKYQLKEGVTSKEYLTSLAQTGLKIRLHNKLTKEYINRLEYELSVITKMNFEDYFLIVYDYILYAKKNNIMVGPGRGSAAGSLVCYCLGITDIDPIKYGLLFERFLNPERISMPDIDTDFPDDRRDEVFNYVKEKYGKKHVAHIITYGTLKTKQVLRDVARALDYPSRDVDSLLKPIPTYPHYTLDEAYVSFPLFAQKVNADKKYRKLFNIAKKLENSPRHASTHAAGVVFSRDNLSDVVPMVQVENDIDSTQYTMEYLEEMGLIKMDFLGLRNLGIISEIVDDIKNNVDSNFDIKKIPLDDNKTFELIDNVNLLGVFQLESSGMMNLARKMHPKTFEELSMMIALFRPGPMENIPEFLTNRENPSRVKYACSALEPILKETYGIIVYQEQIMTIARVMANFSYGKADVLRRAMSKKKIEELEKLENDFIDGCIKNNYDKALAIEIYNLIYKFANYGFNKSHSIAYGLVAYQMAYLKANYPLYFYKALLNGVIGAEGRTYDYLKECSQVGVKVKGVSLNDSGIFYQIKNNEIIMPFGVVKDLGSVSGYKIVEEREKGEFKDYIDTVFRLTVAGVEKNVIENLIHAGGFDYTKMSRYSMSKGLENTLKYVNTHKREISLISSIDDKPIIEDLKDNKQVLANKEKEVLGFYFTYNPIMEYKKDKGINTVSIGEILNITGDVSGFGQITRVYEHKTKRNELMAFVEVADDLASISLAVMPEVYKSSAAFLQKDKYVLFTGKKDKQDSILIKTIKEA